MKNSRVTVDRSTRAINAWGVRERGEREAVDVGLEILLQERQGGLGGGR